MDNTHDNSRQLISEMKEMLNMTKGKKLTLEGLVYGEDGEEMMNDPMAGNVPQEGNVPPEANAQPQPQAQPQGQQMNPEQEVNPLDEDPEVAKLITDIRVSTLEGLRKLAQNPESAQYELLKKIFLLVDKAVEDKVNPEK